MPDSTSNLLTPWCRVLLEKLTGLLLVKKFPAFHGTRRFITALTSVRHLSLSWANPIQSTYPHPTSWRSILILSTHLRLGLPNGLFPSGFPTKTLYATLSSPIRATCPAHLILLDFITRTILGEEYKSFSSSLYNLLHSPVTSSLLGPNILLNTMFSNTLSFLSCRNVSDQVSHPYKTTGKTLDALISQIYFEIKLYMFRTVNTAHHQEFFTVHTAMVYVIQLVSRPVWHIPLLCVQWKTPDDGQRNCPKHVEFNFKNKFEKLVHLVGFIVRTII